MKKLTKLCAALLSAIFLFTGCKGSSTIVDNKNYNFDHNNVAFMDEDGNEVSRTVYVNKNKSAEFYVDITNGMAEISADANFQKILLDSYDAIQKTWGEVETDVYAVGNSVESKDISYLNSFSNNNFSQDTDSVLSQAITANPKTSNEKTIVPKIKLIVTDLSDQLLNYQKLASTLKSEVMEKDLSFAILVVNTAKPFYIFAVGAVQDLSDYLDTFYQMPDVSGFIGNPIDRLDMDKVYPINCTVYAQQCGVMGINYSGITLIENGSVQVAPPGAPPINAGDPNGQPLMDPNGQPPMNPNGQPPMNPNGQPPMNPNGQPGQGAPGDDPNAQPTIDEAGSFSVLRYDCTGEYLRGSFDKDKIKNYGVYNVGIEGTVNFTYDKSEQDSNEDFPWVELAVPEDVSEEDVSVQDIKYIAFKSLYWDGAEEAEDNKNTAGKIKINIPFKVMSQIKLSTLLYDVSTDVYVANEGDSEFYEANSKEEKCFDVALAGAATPSQGMYRIDDMENAAVLNIFVDELKNLPAKSKLDIKFTATQPSAQIPAWAIYESNNGFTNIAKFISLLNDYQADNNKMEATLTCYICAGDEETYEETDIESYADYHEKFIKKLKEKEEKRNNESNGNKVNNDTAEKVQTNTDIQSIPKAENSKSENTDNLSE